MLLHACLLRLPRRILTVHHGHSCEGLGNNTFSCGCFYGTIQIALYPRIHTFRFFAYTGQCNCPCGKLPRMGRWSQQQTTPLTAFSVATHRFRSERSTNHRIRLHGPFVLHSFVHAQKPRADLGNTPIFSKYLVDRLAVGWEHDEEKRSSAVHSRLLMSCPGMGVANSALNLATTVHHYYYI